MKFSLETIALLAIVSFTGIALAQNAASTAKTGTSSASKVSMADKKFVKEAAEGGMAEVEMGELAAQKASGDDVKKFGQRMVDDHSKANDQLKQIASSKGIDVPSQLSAKDKATKDRLSKLSGKEFDRAYMADMVKDHTMDVGEFQKESANGKDMDIKNFAEQTLPTLKDHLKEAKNVRSSMNGSATTTSSTK